MGISRGEKMKRTEYYQDKGTAKFACYKLNRNDPFNLYTLNFDFNKKLYFIEKFSIKGMK